MKAEKKFDCVAMKDRIQKRRREERSGMTEKEIDAQLDSGLRTSTSPIAQLWRRISKEKTRSNAVSAAVAVR